jgi:hypothetical protein
MRAVVTTANTAISAPLTSFTATAGSGEILVQWISSSETDVYAYRIQSMPPDSSHWITIGSVYGHGTSSSAHSYSFLDSTVSGSGTYTYRLAEVDSSGLVAYSSSVQAVYSRPTQFAVFQNFPNPFTSTTTITYDIAEPNRTTVRVYDILGRVITTLADEVEAPKTYTWTFNASKLAAGVYFYKVSSGSHTAVKKMILLH